MSTLPPPTLPRCYRHPDRETGRACTRCGRPACPDCLRTVSVGSQCLECVKASQPDVRTRARYWNARQPTLVTLGLIAVNVAIYIWSVTAGSKIVIQPNQCIDQRAICDLALYGPFVAEGDWYRVISSGFLHFSIFHIGMNMLLLYQLGQLLEPGLGRTRFGLLYLAGLLGGSAGVLLISPNNITGGASGAVFGLMAAAAIGMHRQGVNIFSSGIGMTLILNLVLTFTIPGISIGGHLGGAVAGALCGMVMLAPRHSTIVRWQTYAAPVAISIVALALCAVGVS